MKSPIKILHETEEIKMSVSFSKKAENTNSAEYKTLEEVHLAYPRYKIVKREIKKNDKKESFKGLTYAYMEEYIKTHGNFTENLADFNEMRLLAECHSVRFPHIKEWFLKLYPEVAEFKLYKNNAIEEKIAK